MKNRSCWKPEIPLVENPESLWLVYRIDDVKRNAAKIHYKNQTHNDMKESGFHFL